MNISMSRNSTKSGAPIGSKLADPSLLLMYKYICDVPTYVREKIIVFAAVVRWCRTSSTNGSNVSSIVEAVDTQYLILTLLLVIDTIFGFTIPSSLHTCTRVLFVAVAVNAIMLTFSGMRLLASPIAKNSLRKVSPCN